MESGTDFWHISHESLGKQYHSTYQIKNRNRVGGVMTPPYDGPCKFPFYNLLINTDSLNSNYRAIPSGIQSPIDSRPPEHALAAGTARQIPIYGFDVPLKIHKIIADNPQKV